MELRHLRHFVAVAEEMHFGNAARRLNMAQPPLSQSIRRLELDLGVELFERTRRSVQLTDAGHVFLEESRRVLMQADLARKLAQREAGKEPELRVSFIGPALFCLLPDLLVSYRSASPGINVRLFELSSADQIKGILAADFDIGFVTAGNQPLDGCESMLVERSNFIAAVPASSPLALQQSVSLADLAEQPFILAPQRFPNSSHIFSSFAKAGVKPRVTQEATQVNTAISLVGAGLGCSMVMSTAAVTHPRNVCFLPISDAIPEARFEMVMIWQPEHLSRLGQAFLGFARDHVQRNPQLLDAAATLPTCPVSKTASTGAGGGKAASGHSAVRTRRR